MSSAAPRNPPFRAEHLGSLLRPEKLLNKRHAIQQKKDTEDGLQELEDEVIKAVVQVQTDAGFRAVSDGEYRRHMFWGTFVSPVPFPHTTTTTTANPRARPEHTPQQFPTLHGMQEIHNPDPSIFRPYVPDIAAFLEEEKVPGESVICVGKIRHSGVSSYVPQFEYLKTVVPEERWGEIKMTLAAPNWYHLRYREGRAFPRDVYVDDEVSFVCICVCV
jgi:hypothetical protein